jgi:hypothetical protein
MTGAKSDNEYGYYDRCPFERNRLLGQIVVLLSVSSQAGASIKSESHPDLFDSLAYFFPK